MKHFTTNEENGHETYIFGLSTTVCMMFGDYFGGFRQSNQLQEFGTDHVQLAVCLFLVMMQDK